jgi:hypothetical protein
VTGNSSPPSLRSLSPSPHPQPCYSAGHNQTAF